MTKSWNIELHRRRDSRWEIAAIGFTLVGAMYRMFELILRNKFTDFRMIHQSTGEVLHPPMFLGPKPRFEIIRTQFLRWQP